jgi:hypothetical protein
MRKERGFVYKPPRRNRPPLKKRTRTSDRHEIIDCDLEARRDLDRRLHLIKALTYEIDHGGDAITGLYARLLIKEVAKVGLALAEDLDGEVTLEKKRTSGRQA